LDKIKASSRRKLNRGNLKGRTKTQVYRVRGKGESPRGRKLTWQQVYQSFLEGEAGERNSSRGGTSKRPWKGGGVA